MKVFVVNLDKNADRMEFMDGQLKRLGITYERIPAVYGRSLDQNQLQQKYGAVRAFCVMGQRMRPGEIGCSLSHCEIYGRMEKEAVPIALVLEDDVEIDGAIRQKLLEIESFADTCRPQVFLLSSHAVCDKKSDGIERIHGGSCTDGYVVTLPAAKLIRRANTPVVAVADKWLRWERRFGIEMYRVWPSTIRQNNEVFGTDISNDSRVALTGVRMLLRKAVRIFGVSSDWVWYKLTGK